MEQRTDEWFEARKGKVTASSVGAIIGCDPNRTMSDVLRAMVREHHGAEKEFNGNVATNYGDYHEAGARYEYEMRTGNDVTECGFITHPKYDWLGASPDGIIQGNGLLEIKCPYGLREDQDCNFKSIEELPHYYAQIQTQMFCTGSDFCDFYQWNKYGNKLERVEFDKDYMEDLFVVLASFYILFQQELKNKKHLEPKRKNISNDQVKALLSEYDDLSDAIEFATEKKKEIISTLADISGGEDCEFMESRLFTKVKKAGSISYAKAIKELVPDADLEKWRGKPTIYWKLT